MHRITFFVIWIYYPTKRRKSELAWTPYVKERMLLWAIWGKLQLYVCVSKMCDAVKKKYLQVGSWRYPKDGSYYLEVKSNHFYPFYIWWMRENGSGFTGLTLFLFKTLINFSFVCGKTIFSNISKVTNERKRGWESRKYIPCFIRRMCRERKKIQSS